MELKNKDAQRLNEHRSFQMKMPENVCLSLKTEMMGAENVTRNKLFK